MKYAVLAVMLSAAGIASAQTQTVGATAQAIPGFNAEQQRAFHSVNLDQKKKVFHGDLDALDSSAQMKHNVKESATTVGEAQTKARNHRPWWLTGLMIVSVNLFRSVRKKPSKAPEPHPAPPPPPPTPG